MSKYFYQHGSNELYVVDDNIATDLVFNDKQWTQLKRAHVSNFERLVEVYYSTSLHLCTEEVDNPMYKNNVVSLDEYRKKKGGEFIEDEV